MAVLFLFVIVVIFSDLAVEFFSKKTKQRTGKIISSGLC